MHPLEKITIYNYKCFKQRFTLYLNKGINILVGDNEAGKSTILEAIHVTLSGLINGKYLKNELSQYIFNKQTEIEYLKSLKTSQPQPPPYAEIEIFFSTDQLPLFEGDGNSERKKACGLRLRVEFDTDFQAEYDELVKTEVSTIPIEFYKLTWQSFARDTVSIKSIPVKSVLIDSSSNKYQNGSDIYISKIISDDLVERELIELSQAYRQMKESFMKNKFVEAINKKIKKNGDVSNKSINISVDLSVKNSWENSLMAYFEGIPFHHIGKGEQALIKTNLALAHKKSLESNLILIEEPENHLSHIKLNEFIQSLKAKCADKQIIITTHSSFVANKLNLSNLILLNNQKATSLKELSKETYEFFEKLSGYQTLRLLLGQKVVLVEGPSDELIFQRAYKDKYGMLPIEQGIDVISVGLTFERFLELGEILQKKVAIITDNDGNYEENITKKYEKYKTYSLAQIFADTRENLQTLEPQLIDANSKNLKAFCEMLKISPKQYADESKLRSYMKGHKTDCALQIFVSSASINIPNYINQAVEWCNEQ